VYGIDFTHYAMNILRALCWLLRGPPGDDISDVMKHVGDLMNIFCACKDGSIN